MSKKQNEELSIGYALRTDGFPLLKNHHPIFAEAEVPLDDLKEITVNKDKLELKTKNNYWVFSFK